MSTFKYHYRSLLVRRRTTLASAAGIAMVAYLIAATLMLGAALQKSMRTIDRSDTVVVIRASADNEFSSSLFDEEAAAVATQPGVLHDNVGPLTAPELVIAATLPRSDGARGNVQVRGVTDNVLKVRSNVKIVAGSAPRWSANEVMIGERLRGRFPGFEPGGTFALRKGQTMKVAGVFQAGAAYDSEVWIDRAAVRTIFGREGRLSSVYVRLQSADAFTQFNSALEQDKRLGLQAFRERDYFQQQTEGRATFITAMGSFVGLLFGVGAMIGAMITMFAAVESRQREVGTLRALGFSPSSILFGFLMESSLVALGAGLIGAVSAAGLAFTSLVMLDLTTRTEVVLDFEPTQRVLLSAVLVALIMGLGGGLLPAWRAARVPVLDALKA